VERDPQTTRLAAPLQQIDATHVRVDGRDLIYFGGCDYFRISMHPEIHKAVTSSLEAYGLSVSASRKTTGNHWVYEALEMDLKKFFCARSALFVPTGYMANMIVAEAMPFTHLLIDEKAHPSLWRAVQANGGMVLPFKHREPSAVRKISKELPRTAKIVLLTDGMFPQDGSLAPLAEYRAVLPGGAHLWVDDAHAAGVLGANGRGSVEETGIGRARVVQTITISKAFGVYGGAVLGSKRFVDACIEKSSTFASSTPVPLPLASAGRAALQILSDNEYRRRLWVGVNYWRKTFPGLAPDGKAVNPIISFIPKTSAQAQRLKRLLLAAGIFPSFIHYPGGPPQGYFRFALSSEHNLEQIELLGKALEKTK
jgi:7-keto-8-aminopelargonate synthetase-like enzyme